LKSELEPQDIEAIACKVVEMLKPLLADSPSSPSEDILDVPGLAAYLKVDESWIYKQASLNAIPLFKVGRYTRFKMTEIDKWIASQSVRSLPANLKVLKRLRAK
jgi:excisionase family DNA binding protein